MFAKATSRHCDFLASPAATTCAANSRQMATLAGPAGRKNGWLERFRAGSALESMAACACSTHHWCPEPGSNRHAPFTEAADFKSAVSTNFTIGAHSGGQANLSRKYCIGQADNAIKKGSIASLFNWSGKTVSNRRPQPWQGCALPTELFPQKPGGANQSRTGLTGFAIRGITALLSRQDHENLERENGFEPSTYTLARYRSTN